MIKINCGNKVVLPEIINFPDGTFKIDVEIPYGVTPEEIIWRYENENELIILMYVTSNLRERYHSPISLYMPYLPNARMDRVHYETEVFTLKYFCGIINSLGFDKVKILDVHSSVGAALLDRVSGISPEKYIGEALRLAEIDKENDYIFFPDEGSCKRYSDMFRGFAHMGFGIKKRNWEDGKILGLDIVGESPCGRRIFVVDDICSYGGTVYHSARSLKELGCKEIFVYFTHCENSIAKGHLFEDYLIDRVFTTNSLCTLDTDNYPKLTVIDCGLNTEGKE